MALTASVVSAGDSVFTKLREQIAGGERRLSTSKIEVWAIPYFTPDPKRPSIDSAPQLEGSHFLRNDKVLFQYSIENPDFEGRPGQISIMRPPGCVSVAECESIPGVEWLGKTLKDIKDRGKDPAEKMRDHDGFDVIAVFPRENKGGQFWLDFSVLPKGPYTLKFEFFPRSHHQAYSSIDVHFFVASSLQELQHDLQGQPDNVLARYGTRRVRTVKQYLEGAGVVMSKWTGDVVLKDGTVLNDTPFSCVPAPGMQIAIQDKRTKNSIGGGVIRSIDEKGRVHVNFGSVWLKRYGYKPGGFKAVLAYSLPVQLPMRECLTSVEEEWLAGVPELLPGIGNRLRDAVRELMLVEPQAAHVLRDRKGNFVYLPWNHYWAIHEAITPLKQIWMPISEIPQSVMEEYIERDLSGNGLMGIKEPESWIEKVPGLLQLAYQLNPMRVEGSRAFASAKADANAYAEAHQWQTQDQWQQQHQGVTLDP